MDKRFTRTSTRVLASIALTSIAACRSAPLAPVATAPMPSAMTAMARPADQGAKDSAMIVRLNNDITRINSDWAGLRRYRTANAALAAPAAGENRVVFYGNSITDGWARYFPTQFPGKPYVGRGIGGQTTPQMLIRFNQDVVALQPKVVVILAGTNDIAGNTGPSTLEMIEDNLRSMTEIAKSHHIRVVLSSILPVFDYPWKPGLEPAPKIIAVNAWMKKYAAEVGETYLDYHTAMADERAGLPKSTSSDGVHPNEAGYRIMAPLADAAIARALALPSEVPVGLRWFRTSAEQRAAYVQTYRNAEATLARRAAGLKRGSWAVILDADETVIDNSPYEQELAQQHAVYSDVSWGTWVSREAAPALPGAVSFTSRVHALGGHVVIVTNRDDKFCASTSANIKRVGIVADQVMCRTDPKSSSKDPRFDAVAMGAAPSTLPPQRLVMWVGDNIQDFPHLTQALRAQDDGAYKEFGDRFIALPNPMYGSWERNVMP